MQYCNFQRKRESYAMRLAKIGRIHKKWQITKALSVTSETELCYAISQLPKKGLCYAISQQYCEPILRYHSWQCNIKFTDTMLSVLKLLSRNIKPCSQYTTHRSSFSYHKKVTQQRTKSNYTISKPKHVR
jgi:hypothetical protein